MSDLNYDTIEELCEQLADDEKLRLAQFLIQLVREDAEEKNAPLKNFKARDSSTIDYIVERLVKLKPTKKKTLLNSIGSMFQFQGGISDQDKEAVLHELEKRRYIVIDSNGRVSYNFWD